MIRYYKLFDLLNRKGLKKTSLLEVISSPTLAKLQKGEVIKSDIIEKICVYLHCQPGDIMEIIYNENENYNEQFKKMGLIGYTSKEVYPISEKEEVTMNKYSVRDEETKELIYTKFVPEDIDENEIENEL